MDFIYNIEVIEGKKPRKNTNRVNFPNPLVMNQSVTLEGVKYTVSEINSTPDCVPNVFLIQNLTS